MSKCHEDVAAASAVASKLRESQSSYASTLAALALTLTFQALLSERSETFAVRLDLPRPEMLDDH